jgi:hypothetical protein
MQKKPLLKIRNFYNNVFTLCRKALFTVQKVTAVL